jgi:hypothetical protein
MSLGLAAVRILMVATASAVAAGQSWSMHPSDHFEIFIRASDTDRLGDVRAAAENAYRRVSVGLNYELSEKMLLIVVRTDRELPTNSMQAVALVNDSGAGDRHHLLLSLEGLDRRPAHVAHELTHQFVFELLPEPDRVAPWTEGLADHEAGVWDQTQLAKLREATARQDVPSIDRLTNVDRHWVHAVFEYVEAEYGPLGVRRYLTALTGGSNAVQRAFGVTSTAFDRRFRLYLANRFGAR